MKTKSWKHAATMPRFLAAAVRKGLKIADSIAIEEANDKTWLTIKFTKFLKPGRSSPVREDAQSTDLPAAGSPAPRGVRDDPAR